MTYKGVLYIKMFSSLSGVRMIFWLIIIIIRIYLNRPELILKRGCGLAAQSWSQTSSPCLAVFGVSSFHDKNMMEAVSENFMWKSVFFNEHLKTAADELWRIASDVVGDCVFSHTYVRKCELVRGQMIKFEWVLESVARIHNVGLCVYCTVSLAAFHSSL